MTDHDDAPDYFNVNVSGHDYDPVHYSAPNYTENFHQYQQGLGFDVSPGFLDPSPPARRRGSRSPKSPAGPHHAATRTGSTSLDPDDPSMPAVRTSKTSRQNHNHSEARYRFRLNHSITALAELLPECYLRSSPTGFQGPPTSSAQTPMSNAALFNEGINAPPINSERHRSASFTSAGLPNLTGGVSPGGGPPGGAASYPKREVLDAASAYIKDLRNAVRQASDELTRLRSENARMGSMNRELEQRVRDLTGRVMTFEYMARSGGSGELFGGGSGGTPASSGDDTDPRYA